MRREKTIILCAVFAVGLLFGTSSLSYAQPVRVSTVETSDAGTGDPDYVVLEAAVAAGAVVYAVANVLSSSSCTNNGNRRPPLKPNGGADDADAFEALLDQ